MFEMATVSMNKVRLEFYVKEKSWKASLLKHLVDRPSRLFGTTLIMVNTVMQMGSEFARRFYESAGLSPDWAPVSQIILVVIFGELVPLFAARRHSEQVALTLVPVVYVFSKILIPIVFIVDKISSCLNFIFRNTEKGGWSLSREEIQKAFEDKKLMIPFDKKEPITSITKNIFSLKSKLASELMQKIDELQTFSSKTLVKEIENKKFKHPFLFLFFEDPSNIVGYVHIRDLIKAHDQERLMAYAKPPWFIQQTEKVTRLLKQFRQNNQLVALVQDFQGSQVGYVMLDDVVDEIFGHQSESPAICRGKVVIEKTILGDMSIEEFNKKFNTDISQENIDTINELIIDLLGHKPTFGDSVQLNQFEFFVVEASVFGAKRVRVRTFV